MTDETTTTAEATEGATEATGDLGGTPGPDESPEPSETAPEAAETQEALALTVGWVGGMRMNIEWLGGDWSALQEALTQNKYLEVVQYDGIPVLVNVDQVAVLFRRAA